ncbi:MAG: hypothetical protein KF753_23100 [Caldilineaceae bacterium]|nr:hypothetical protein [Caldilineaceae bacterium]
MGKMQMCRFLLWKLYFFGQNLFQMETAQALTEYSITLMLLVIITVAAIAAMGMSVFDLLNNSAKAMVEA